MLLPPDLNEHISDSYPVQVVDAILDKIEITGYYGPGAPLPEQGELLLW